MRKIFKYLQHMLAVSGVVAMLCSCEKELPFEGNGENAEPGERVTSVVHYVATVNNGNTTRATIDEDKHYIFETGDRLFITSGENMYGYLVLISGAGKSTATFEGELKCVNDFEPTESTSLSATLVSLKDQIHICASAKITATTYPDDEYASSLADAFSKYSNFTAVSTYGSRSFTLSQNSSFLVFSVTFGDNVSTGANVTTVFENAGSVQRSATLQTALNDGSVQINFATAFPSGTQLSSAQLSVTVEGGSENSFNVSDKTLAANRFYTINRSLFVLPDFFTIQAAEDNTDITFQYATSASDGIQYSTDGGANWADYLTSQGAITLENAGDRVGFRGKRDAYYNSSGNTPLFTVTDNKPCYVYGNIMSLISDDEYNPKAEITTVYAFRQAFQNCTWLRVANGKKLLLSATTLSANCSYEKMFMGCTGLEVTPVDNLPALTVQDGSYYEMFSGCTSMTSAPTISATTLARNCYWGMFTSCTKLEVAPSLPVDAVMPEGCYQQMFKGCATLKYTPSLPASGIGKYSYKEMFSGCSNLQTGPELNIASVQEQSCYQMFLDCNTMTSVTGSFTASTLAKSAYEGMFSGCSSLTTAPSLGTVTSVGVNTCQNMFNNCSSLTAVSGDFSAVSTLYQGSFCNMFASCSSLTSCPTFGTISTVGKESCRGMFYNCSLLPTPTIALNAGQLYESCYLDMFYGCAKITSMSIGTITQLATGCCYKMFAYCYSLNSVSGTITDGTLEGNCYREMFRNCNKLTSAPDFGIVTTVNTTSCYYMFFECSSLTSASIELNAETLYKESYSNMFYGCSKLSTAPSIGTITTVAENCCRSMFRDCSSLTSIGGTFNATVLAKECYREMFYGCKNLTTFPTFAEATTLGNSCYFSLFCNCTELTSSPITLSCGTLETSCYQSMFYGCTKLTTAPDLPAATLVNSCYREMFRGCTSLNAVKCLATSISASDCTKDWMNNVSSSGTFTKAASMTTWSTGTSGIPSNWTVQDNP